MIRAGGERRYEVRRRFSFIGLFTILCATFFYAAPSDAAESSAGSVAEGQTGEGWSQDLLARLLSAPAGGAASSAAAADGMVLRSYQLRVLRLGDPGRATNLVSILQRMLPPDSRVTEDRPANTLHVLSTLSAQQAALELVSAMDAEAAATAQRAEPSSVPDDVRKALETLAASRPDSEQLMKIIAESSRQAEARLTEVVRQSQEDSRSNFRQLLFIGGGALIGVVLIVMAAIAVSLRRAQKRELQAASQRQSDALALLPTQSMETMISFSRDQQERTKELQALMESFSIAYQADRQRNTMIMESVAKKHGELAATLGQMEQLRREMGENAGRMFLEVNREAIDQIIAQASAALKSRAEEVGLIAESASRKMEETANRLEVQNAKAAALADELERTQKEVDGLFEKLKAAQEAAQQAQNEANEQRRIACEKTAELTKKEAALAGLSLLMQEPMHEILDTLKDADSDRDSTPATIIEPVAPFDPAIGEDKSAPKTASDSVCLPTAEEIASTSSESGDSACPTTHNTFRISPAA